MMYQNSKLCNVSEEIRQKVFSYLPFPAAALLGLTCQKLSKSLETNLKITEQNRLADVWVKAESDLLQTALWQAANMGNELPKFSVVGSMKFNYLLSKDPGWKPCCRIENEYGVKYGCQVVRVASASAKKKCKCSCNVCTIIRGDKWPEEKYLKKKSAAGKALTRLLDKMAEQAKKEAGCEDDTCDHRGDLFLFKFFHSWEDLLAIDLTACNQTPIPTPNAAIVAAIVAAPVAAPVASAPAQASCAAQG